MSHDPDPPLCPRLAVFAPQANSGRIDLLVVGSHRWKPASVRGTWLKARRTYLSILSMDPLLSCVRLSACALTTLHDSYASSAALIRICARRHRGSAGDGGVPHLAEPPGQLQQDDSRDAAGVCPRRLQRGPRPGRGGGGRWRLGRRRGALARIR